MTHSKIWLSSQHLGGTEQNFVQEAFEYSNALDIQTVVFGASSDINIQEPVSLINSCA